MIIDAHVYSLPDRLRQKDCLFPLTETAVPTAIHKSAAPAAEVDLALQLSSADEILHSMKTSGIDVSVLTALPWRSPILCSENNEYILENVASSQGLFIPVCAVSPANGKWRKEARKCIDQGAVGLKINPAWQACQLDDADVVRLAAFCAEADVFLEIHIDHAFKDSPASASSLCDLLRACPTTRILATHLGGMLGLYAHDPSIAVLLENLWFDTAVSSTLQFVDFYIQTGLDRRIVFGSDFPFNHSHSQRQVVEGVRARGYDSAVFDAIFATNFRDLCGTKLSL